jgi:hypothetical protein
MKKEINKKLRYYIVVEDAWHQPLTSDEDRAEYSYTLGEYADYDSAYLSAKNFTDKNFAIAAQNTKTESDFCGYWYHWGEVVYLYDRILGSCPFCSCEYIEEQIKKHYNQQN